MVASTVEGLHFLDAVDSRMLSLSIQFLLHPIFFGVPIFSVRAGRIHGLTPVIGQHTRPPRPVTFGRDPLFSVDPWHDDLAVVAQCVRGSGGNSPGSTSVQRPRFSFGTVDRPVG